MQTSRLSPARIVSAARFPDARPVLRHALLKQRGYATVSGAAQGAPPTATNRAQATLKRFWKTVDIQERDGGLAVTLDKRALKTPSGNPLVLPKNKSLVATLIANEWENQETVLKSHALPMTSLAARAIDTAKDPKSRTEIREALIKYLDTDTVCFHQLEPEALARLQKAHWDPLLDWARATFDVPIHTFFSVLSSTQPPETTEKLANVLAELDSWELAAMERTTYTTKSFIIGLGLVKKHLNAEQAALAASVEVNSQIEKWGEVEDSHDVDYHDIRRQLASAACLLCNI
ncbi:ATP12-domain-containing protein [Gloeophyllum trabeum ATCC 11539]|uniref:ATP12-domain-containing protein n=1 Tax=Gloeophyllum trabeum (strain ATCC 11539 / FP-39264 / Madison 617) TaxID=670483 RepID=S7QFJ1_GLOTA|nr:ATP12-domain-containing protein [Gloeophyllum trabeum ATCC 11539]EPQ58611.1 ATP12-domain-containing protein [Gloeophyllum trabeum ATCC 11539]